MGKWDIGRIRVREERVLRYSIMVEDIRFMSDCTIHCLGAK